MLLGWALLTILIRPPVNQGVRPQVLYSLFLVTHQQNLDRNTILLCCVLYSF